MMNDTTYTCAVIEDLIPLLSEGLCSEESRAAIEEHTKTCTHCRALCEAVPEITLPEQNSFPDEAKTFRKVTRRITKSRRLNKLLGICLAATAIPVIVLSIGSIGQWEHFPSFESLMQSLEVRKLAKEIAKGNFEPYLGYLYYCDYNSWNMSGISTLEQMEDLYAADLKLLNDAYEANLTGKKLKSVRVHSYYNDYGMVFAEWNTDAHLRQRSLSTDAEMEFDDGTAVSLSFSKNRAGVYICDGFGGGNHASDEAEAALGNAFFWVSDHLSTWLPSVEYMFENPVVSDSRLDMMVNYFAPEYCDRMRTAFSAFLADYVITDFTVSERHYDAENVQVYYEIAVTAEDSKGSATLHTRIYESPDRFIPPEPDAGTVYTDGCTPELAAALRVLFGAGKAAPTNQTN